mmetsp:Transcript_15766/g.30047  ORF Transcript_15766/g.30047 Transcript_15766/m.30047 type:complete len:345 (-) Transcript_15766:225-1259(-)
MPLIPEEYPTKDLTIYRADSINSTISNFACKMAKVTLHQELQAAVVFRLLSRSKMGGWKDPFKAFRSDVHPLKEVLEDIRYRRNPYLERKDPASQPLRQSIIRSKVNRDIKKVALQNIPMHNRCLKATLFDISNRRAPYFERNGRAEKAHEAIVRIQLQNQIKQVASSKTQVESDRLVLLSSIQKKVQDIQKPYKVDTTTTVRPAFLEDIHKHSQEVLTRQNSEKEEVSEVNIDPELETVMFDDFSSLHDARTDPVLHHLSTLEQMVVDLSCEVKLMRSQMQEMINYSKTHSPGGLIQEVTFLGTSHSVHSTCEEAIGQTENMRGIGPISAVVVEDHDDWVELM